MRHLCGNRDSPGTRWAIKWNPCAAHQSARTAGSYSVMRNKESVGGSLEAHRRVPIRVRQGYSAGSC